MKKIIYSLLFIGLLACLTACEKFTEITPKGKNLLNKVSDIETVLNFNFSTNGGVAVGSPAARSSAEGAFYFQDANVLVGDYTPFVQSVTGIITAPSKTLDYVNMTYDEAINRAALTATDIKYSKMYFIINNVANAVIANVDEATGDRTKGNQLKAEALVLRAYFHYWLVNLFAKAYNPATAASDPGIPYVKEDNAIGEANKKSTVAEVYTNIMADLDAALALNSLPNKNVNAMRVGLGFAYAAKARVLLSMRRYPEALQAADQSLAINNQLDDHRKYAPVGTTVFAHPEVVAPEEYFYAADAPSTKFFLTITPEVIQFYETGDIINQYVKPYSTALDPLIGLPGSLTWFSGTYAKNTAGLNTSDSYLVKAECLARAGAQQNIAGAMQIINLMRQNRIHPSVYAPLTASTEAQAMAALKKFSRIEFLYTGKNYLNIKRWNTEDAYKETIKRTINGTVYQLRPESPLWIFPFPQNATDYNPNLTQNY
ncbi:RagB/SusD family nutrient uptake outer membrane protein [Pedobacter africanus]|uniref:SusD family protein n=1 Tax=Pedobacter africanus TaxID=151894 RepID=A0A1W2B0X6_9SPHI|nr:RagB/SusD family nutrient uptake outer membrane protein [Pedobacter africanus]SMC66058.1 SusD family protein [Pedobacter africanus]